MANAGQHRIKYVKEGDYGQLRPLVVSVEYQDGRNIHHETCMRCVYGEDVPHSKDCVTKYQQLMLDLGDV